MLTFVVILAIMSTVLELMIAAKIPFMRQLSHKSKLFNLINSLFLSYIMGLAFGAAGLIAMTAGVLSTMMSVPGYAFLYWAYDSPEAQAHGGNLIQHKKIQFINSINQWKQTCIDFMNLIFKILKIITFPIWFARSCYIKFSRTSTSNTTTN